MPDNKPEDDILLFNSGGVLHRNQNPWAIVRLTPSHSGRFTQDPEYIIAHYTAGGGISGTVQRFLNQQKPRASAHFVIGRKGEIVQMLSLDHIGWHAGRSTHMDKETGDLLNGMNKYSIGIEFGNWGYLHKQPDGTFRTDIGSKYYGTDVHEQHQHGQRFWEPYTDAQIEAGLLVTRSIDYYFNGRIKDVLHHSDIAPSRKSDAGPAFPMARFKDTVDDRASMDGIV